MQERKPARRAAKSRAEPKISTLRIATFNMCSGRDPSTGTVDPEQLRTAVGALDADVLALQEVDRDQRRSGLRDQAADAAEAMGCAPGNWRFAAALGGTPGEQWAAQAAEGPGPAYGVALLSRLPVQQWSEIRLAPPPAAGRGPAGAGFGSGGPGGRSRLMLLEDEPRVALVAVVEINGRSLTLVSTHLSFVPGWNVRQLRQLHRELKSCPRPLILAGDLNIPGRLPALITGWQPRVRAHTFPAPYPRSQLDHVLTDGLSAGTPGRAVQLGLSDHQALVVDVPL
jgi:endonuclease/exonuclease/phosphatase family metal-dependent hydrolase